MKRAYGGRVHRLLWGIATDDYFYAATAISIVEFFHTSPEATGDFMKALFSAPGDAADRNELLTRAQAVTGVDIGELSRIVHLGWVEGDSSSTPSGRPNIATNTRTSKADLAAIARMRKSGITEADIEYEHQVGYNNGRKSPFYYDSCLSALALAMKNIFNSDGEQIEKLISRIEEICDEEICTADILDRCAREACVDVSQLAKTTSEAEWSVAEG